MEPLLRSDTVKKALREADNGLVLFVRVLLPFTHLLSRPYARNKIGPDDP